MDDLKKLYIEPTSRCNLDCTMCFRTSWLQDAFTDMEAPVFETVLQTMPETVETALFGGMGEPLLHSNIIRMVAGASEKGKRVALVTNATLLTPEKSHGLIEAGLDMLWVSMDSFDERAYEGIRRNSSFALVQENVQAFNRIRQKNGGLPGLGVNFVAMKSNVGQLPLISRFVTRYSINEVNISNLIPTDRRSEQEILYDGLTHKDCWWRDPNAATVRLPLMNWHQAGVMEGMRDLFSFLPGTLTLSGHPLNRRINRCRFIEEGNAFVRCDGKISPCMALLYSATTYWTGRPRVIHHHSFGDVRSQGLAAIWNSEEYRLFRDRVRRFDFSPCLRCGGCDNWEQNIADCFGNKKPVCGACLWSEGVISCP